MLVYSVSEGSGSAAAGIQPGDLIVKAEGQVVKSVDELNDIRDQKKAGDNLQLTVIREGELLNVPVTLGADLPQQNQ